MLWSSFNILAIISNYPLWSISRWYDINSFGLSDWLFWSVEESSSNEMARWLATTILAISCFLAIIEGAKYLRLANCDCKVNNEYLNLTKCNLKALSREKVTTNVDFFLLKQISNVTSHISVFQMSSSGQFYPFLFNYWVNNCDVIKESSKVTFLAKQIKRIAQRYSNTAKCVLKVSCYNFCCFYSTFLISGRFLLL